MESRIKSTEKSKGFKYNTPDNRKEEASIADFNKSISIKSRKLNSSFSYLGALVARF